MIIDASAGGTMTPKSPEEAIVIIDSIAASDYQSHHDRTLIQKKRACRVHGDVDRGRWTIEQLLQLDPNSAGTHITLANIYAAKGRWKEAAHIRKSMKSKGVIKERGWSWVNVNDQLNAFVAGDQAHPQSEHITTILELLSANIGDAQQEIRALHEDVEDLAYGYIPSHGNARK
ncbi:hypothetical protein JHK82_050505 [Glycine max]|nr:hypothetical protein JHK82_050505 [Glycine max]